MYLCRCTFFFGTPTMYVDILSIFENLSPELRGNALKLAITGGAPCSPDLMKNFKKSFPDAVLMVRHKRCNNLITK